MICRYFKRAKIISSRYRDQPLTPMQTAIYWVEYVARHKGAFHMHSAGQDLSFIEYHNLDIFGLMLFAVAVFAYALKLILRFICCKLCGTNHDSSQKRRNNKKNK